MKGIILAGGSGSRLYPLTISISKQLLPIYDKPMIYYPLSVLMLGGIRDVLIICTNEYLDNYQRLLGDGSKLGIKISYAVQDKPRGLAEAFIIGEDFIGDDCVSLILGDNLFYASNFGNRVAEVSQRQNGATILACYVKDPTAYGVVEIDNQGRPVSIEEKPLNPKSNLAVPGLYFFDNRAIQYAKETKPSKRGELEITSVIDRYLNDGELNIEIMGRGLAWLDTGTHESLLEASNFVEAIQNRQGLVIACIEEIAYNKGYIDKKTVLELSDKYKNSEYGKYLNSLVSI